MTNYNRLGYEIKRDFVNFSKKICKELTRPKCKFVTQMIYGILAGNKVHLSEIARSLNETVRPKKTIWRLSRNLFAFEEKETVMENYISKELRKRIAKWKEKIMGNVAPKKNKNAPSKAASES